MNEENLTPAAQEQLKNLTPPLDTKENWSFSYLSMLRGLAEREIPTLSDVEIKGQGLEVLERSREDHAVALELQAFAQASLGPDLSSEIAKLPTRASLDDFLANTMRATGKQVLRDRFLRFLHAKAEASVDEQMEIAPKAEMTREERIRHMAEGILAHFEADGLAAPTQLEYRTHFRAWWKSQDEGNTLADHNSESRLSMEVRRRDLIALLPSRTNQAGFSKKQWKEKAERAGLIESLRTFNRDVKDLIDPDSPRVKVQNDGSFRQLPK